MGWFSRASKVDSAYSLSGWAYTGLQLAFPATVAGVGTVAATYRDWIWAEHGLFGALVAGVVLAVLASLALLIVAGAARLWRRAPVPAGASITHPAAPTRAGASPRSARFRREMSRTGINAVLHEENVYEHPLVYVDSRHLLFIVIFQEALIPLTASITRNSKALETWMLIRWSRAVVLRLPQFEPGDILDISISGKPAE